jgi:hypothetical protein
MYGPGSAAAARLHPVGGELAVKRQSGSETDRGNAGAKQDNQVRQREVRLRRRVAQASCHRASGGRDARSTTLQSNTHSTESRVVLYPWHPWYGRTVWVYDVRVKTQGTFVDCSLEQICEAPARQVPQWMFDPSVCHQMHLRHSPVVSCQALVELKELLAHVPAQARKDVLEVQHRFLSCTGGADARLIEPATGGATQAVSSSEQQPTLGSAAVRDPAAKRAPAGKTAARALDTKAGRRSARGGDR